MPDETPPPIAIDVLIVDDDESHAEAVADSLAPLGCDCTTVSSGAEAVRRIESDSFDVVITDLRMDDVDGLEVLRRAKEELSEAEVIVLTGHSSVGSAVTAMQGGAYTYLTKPLDISELRAAVEKASERIRLIRRNAQLSSRLDEKFGFEGVIGVSPATQKVIAQLKSVAATDATVLITGENGTGKELAARALHQNSPRKSKPFVSLNVAALPKDILESELFGHEAGAFTGATGKRVGKFEYAHGGTLFLDEVGELPPHAQVKLLRALQEGEVDPVGATRTHKVDVRVISATNRDMIAQVQEGSFREDLYYRLNVFPIALPPLARRRADIAALAEHFLARIALEEGRRNIRGITPRAATMLEHHDWPGNVRQLENAVFRAVVLCEGDRLDVGDFPQIEASLPDGATLEAAVPAAPDAVPDTVGGDVRRERVAAPSMETPDPHVAAAPPRSPAAPAVPAVDATGTVRRMDDVEADMIRFAIDHHDGRMTRVAKSLGMGRSTLYRKLKELGLDGASDPTRPAPGERDAA